MYPLSPALPMAAPGLPRPVFGAQSPTTPPEPLQSWTSNSSDPDNRLRPFFNLKKPVQKPRAFVISDDAHYQRLREAVRKTSRQNDLGITITRSAPWGYDYWPSRLKPDETLLVVLLDDARLRVDEQAIQYDGTRNHLTLPLRWTDSPEDETPKIQLQGMGFGVVQTLNPYSLVLLRRHYPNATVQVVTPQGPPPACAPAVRFGSSAQPSTNRVIVPWTLHDTDPDYRLGGHFKLRRQPRPVGRIVHDDNDWRALYLGVDHSEKRNDLGITLKKAPPGNYGSWHKRLPDSKAMLVLLLADVRHKIDEKGMTYDADSNTLKVRLEWSERGIRTASDVMLANSATSTSGVGFRYDRVANPYALALIPKEYANATVQVVAPQGPPPEPSAPRTRR